MCATLSGGVDSLIRKKQIVSMAEAMVTDSLASAVIEQVCDKAEEIILKDFNVNKFYPIFLILFFSLW